MGQAEQRLTSRELLISLANNLVLFTLGLQALQSLIRFKTRLERSILLESITELVHFLDKALDADDKVLLEVGFLRVHGVADNFGLANESEPLLIELILVV